MNALCFGDISYGQVVTSDGNTYGVPDRPGFYEFKQTQRCFTMQWNQIAAGGYHSCGITLKDSYGRNQLVCWGLQDDGQINVTYPGAAACLPTGIECYSFVSCIPHESPTLVSVSLVLISCAVLLVVFSLS
jgi:hypothetical protein